MTHIGSDTDSMYYEASSQKPVVDAMAPRVGGGYATKFQVGHYAYKYVDCTVKTELVDLKPMRCEKVETFNAKGVKAVAVVHGGASLWTAEETGEVAIRDPSNGEIHHTVKRDNETVLMTKMSAHGAHVWVGAEDGGVEVYDNIIAVLVGRHVVHTSPVLDFSYDETEQIMYSICSDLVVKWSGEEASFQKLTSHKPDSKLTALTSSASHVFVGDHLGTVIALNTHLNVIGQWEAHPNATVSSMLCFKNYLFSAGSENVLHCWNADVSNGPVLLHTREDLHGVEVIRSMHPDTASNQVWSVSDTLVHRWACSMETTPPFTLCEETDNFRSVADITGLAMFTPWIAQRLWSVGSNGKNVSWFASHSVAAEEMEHTANEMRTITVQDDEESTKWKELITKVKGRDHKRKEALTNVLRDRTDVNLRHVYYWNWVKWLIRKKEMRRQHTMQNLLERNTVFDLAKDYFSALRDAAKEAKAARRRRNLATHIAALSEKSFLRIYWDKLKKFQDKVRRKKNKEKLVDVLLCNTNMGLLSRGYRALVEHKKKKRSLVKIDQLSGKLLDANSKDLKHYYYGKLYRHAMKRKEAKKKQHLSSVLRDKTDRELQEAYYKRFVDKVKQYQMEEAKKQCCESMGNGYDMKLLRDYYEKLKLCRILRSSETMSTGYDALALKQEKLLAEQLEQTFPDLRKQEQELALKVEDMKRRKIEAEEKIKKMEARKKALRERIDRQKMIEKSIFEQFADIMAKLKELSLNFEQDRDLIMKVTEKCRASHASKVFLEAHMEIKAVVVRVSGQSALGKDDLWPLDYVLPRLQSHELRKLYIGVKIMVIAFDILTQTDMALLDTDDEIVLNGGNLIELYKVSEKARVRR
eukprot:TRINITY_DN13587_c0_g1_i1.p1 TRINITY_DN13587_c0_g1~~TRINITY_DN13587_c0_g1_i1.p1  ORF type:complete len:894 (+),score=151.93 TRINITY_DN13587_c0_g1_i1:87-2684(+)